MRALAGLLSTTGGSGSTLRLHPLIEGYCERRRFEETPERLRAIHRGIAQALARRGRLVEALRHAAEGSDTTLLGRIAESTGGVRLWLEHGLEGLRTVNGLLTAEALSTNPRLALLRCVALTAERTTSTGRSGCTARRPRRRPASRATARAATTRRCSSTTSSCSARSTCSTWMLSAPRSRSPGTVESAPSARSPSLMVLTASAARSRRAGAY